MNDVKKLTEIDLSDLQIGEKLTIYRGSGAFLTGPAAAGYVGEATVADVKKRSAMLHVKYSRGDQVRPHPGEREVRYKLRFRDGRILRVPNGEPTMLYVHARTGRPTVTAYFTDDEYKLVKRLLTEASEDGLFKTRRNALSALGRMAWHDSKRTN